MSAATPSIHVCQSSTCRRKGSEAALLEIEELIKLVDICGLGVDVDVHPTNCLGYCNKGPAVALKNPVSKEEVDTYDVVGLRTTTRTRDRIYVRTNINSFQRSTRVVEEAIGQELKLDEDDDDNIHMPPETKLRLKKMRTKRKRDYAISKFQWNRALHGLRDEIEARPEDEDDEDLKMELRKEYHSILTMAGFGFTAPDGQRKIQIPTPTTAMPTSSIQNYVAWTLSSVQIVSFHSVIFTLFSKDKKRSTPHPRGSGKLASPITWHVTMLGEVGKNLEGPLPWIERDYTPISSALEWERGQVRILIKVYNMGLLTSWLRQHRMPTNITSIVGGGGTNTETLCNKNQDSSQDLMKIWLSKPLPTLSIPFLVPDDDNSDGFQPSSVLLLLAGTGIVALPQILAHREPYRLLGIPTPKSKQLQCPIDLILSCREDDLLMVDEIKGWCEEGTIPPSKRGPKYRGLRNCMLLVTGSSNNNKQGLDKNVPFPEYDTGGSGGGGMNFGASLKQLEEKTLSNANLTIQSKRLNKDMIAESLDRMVQPCRVVVSGPDSFNQAARECLEECDFPTSTQLTVLSA